jgi:hypothetical protein
MRIERFRTFVKHSTVERYMANRNQNWMVFRDRWEGLRDTWLNKTVPDTDASLAGYNVLDLTEVEMSPYLQRTT